MRRKRPEKIITFHVFPNRAALPRWVRASQKLLNNGRNDVLAVALVRVFKGSTCSATRRRYCCKRGSSDLVRQRVIEHKCLQNSVYLMNNACRCAAWT